MPEHDDIRDAFLARAERAEGSSSPVLDGLRPRMRRARLIRTSAVAGASFAVVAVVGLGIASIASNPEPGTTIIADEGQDQGESPSPTPQPTATDQVDDQSESTPAPVELPDASDNTPDAENPTVAEVDPTVTPAAQASPSPEPTPEPATTPTEGPSPTEPSPTPGPTASPDPAGMTEVIETAGGDITVEYTLTLITSTVPDPAPGFSDEIEKEEPTEVKVIFRAGETVIEVEIHIEDGILDVDISPDDENE